MMRKRSAFERDVINEAKRQEIQSLESQLETQTANKKKFTDEMTTLNNEMKKLAKNTSIYGKKKIAYKMKELDLTKANDQIKKLGEILTEQKEIF